MLGKLLKHEFAATGRIMWVIYAAMAALSVFANLSIRLLDSPAGDHGLPTALAVLILVAWGLALLIGGVATIVLIVKRFHQNLLTDEGYLMFTLPGTVHHLVLAKIIAAAVWQMATIAVIAICVLIAVFQSEFLGEILRVGAELYQNLTAYYALNGAAVIVEVIVTGFIGCSLAILQFYSAMSIGYGFTSHKALWSVVFYFIQNAVLRIVETIVLSLALSDHNDLFIDLWQDFDLSVMQTLHMTVLGTCFVELILAAAFYFLTTWNLSRRLNLA